MGNWNGLGLTLGNWFLGAGVSWLHSEKEKQKKNGTRSRKVFTLYQRASWLNLFIITLFICRYSLTHVLCCTPPLHEHRVSRLWQAQKVEEVRKQSEVASQKLKEKIYEKLDSAEENRQNQIKSIRLKLQEHVSTG